MKKVFHKIYWNLAILNRDAAGETYAFVYTKTTVFGNEELSPFLETPKLILTLMQTIDIGLKQSKKISNDQELIQSDPISCPQNQKGNN